MRLDKESPGTLEKNVGHIEENTIEFTEKGNIELVEKTPSSSLKRRH